MTIVDSQVEMVKAGSAVEIRDLVSRLGGRERKNQEKKQKCRLSPEGGLAFHDIAVSEKLLEKRERRIQEEVKRYRVFYEKFISEGEERWDWRV